MDGMHHLCAPVKVSQTHQNVGRLISEKNVET
jgi:hypothetical protein